MHSPAKFVLIAAAAVLVSSLVLHADAAESKTATTITVKKLHCAGCARKIAKRLMEVPGVAEVTPDVKAATLTVAPRAGKAPSPRAMWEAVEQAGYTPSQLKGPGGTYTKKPRA